MMADDRPNILFVMTDQQSWRMLSCAGNADVHTPALDRLASEGVRFDKAYCSIPVCVPSRFSLFTGRMASAVGMRSNEPANPDQWLPEAVESKGMGWLLKDAGYRCVYGGKQHFPCSRAHRLGFEYFESDERDTLAERCAEFLQSPQDDPFCLVASFINPHDICYMAIRDFVETEFEQKILDYGETECRVLDEALQRPAGVSEDEFFEKHCPGLPPNVEPQDDEPQAIRELISRRPFRMKARQQWSDQRWREHRWAYARLTEMVDRQIGRVLEALDNGPHADNTVVIFTSDHGDMDSAHRMEHKTAFYEESAHVPLIVRDPAAPGPAGRVDTQNVISNGLDLIPTVCDYAGADVPDELMGQSFKPLVRQPERVSDRPCVPIENEIGHAVVSARHKYIRYDAGEACEQMFDLTADPYETRSVAQDPGQAEALARHRQWFDELFERISGQVVSGG